MTTAAPLSREKSLTYEEERGKPLPTKNHAKIQTRLTIGFSKHPGVDVLPEFTLELAPGQVKTPDISVCPSEPMDLRHDVVRPSDPPLLTVEIVSPSQGMQEIMNKVDFTSPTASKVFGSSCHRCAKSRSFFPMAASKPTLRAPSATRPPG